jgi:phosphoribosylformimino-5-aminoimidazole carboxamide ribotide isomerase
MKQVTVFSDSPSAQAKVFADLGASWLHVVDLNGAVSGAPQNTDAVQSIIDVVAAFEVKKP